MSIQKAEMSVEQIENGQIVEQVVYPFVEYDHVTMENGMDIMSMIRDDVSTPTVTHDATSWRVGQGDGDVSKSIVDSSVAIMTIKGQTYQNILPSPSLRNSMTNGKTMQKLNEGYDSVNTVDGVCKSAILSGQTLVNLYENIQKTTSSVATYNDEWITLKANGGYARYFHSKSDMLKPSTKYLIIVDVKENTLQGSNSLQINDYGITDTVFNTSMSVSGSGIFKLVSTTKDDLTNKTIDLRCLLTSSNTSGLITFRVMVIEYQEGMENWDIPYFEGMKSVRMPVLKATGKNLFDGELELGDISLNGGIQTQGDFAISKNFNVINGGVNVICSIENYTQGRIYYYDGNKNYISSTLIANLEKTPQNAKYFKLRFNKDFLNSDIMVGYGTSNISYEPYKSNILTVNEPIELRGIGEAKDELNLLTSEVVERTGEIVLNGNESWKLRATTTDVLVFNVDDVGINSFTDFTNSHKKMLCDKFVCGYYENNNVEFTCCRANGKGLLIGILKSRLSTPDIEGLKAWLSSNNVTVQYQLANEQIKTVDLSILDQDNQPTTQLNSFANGYIQVSSQGLIPSVDYEVPTSNSYHVDLMKPNTQYTMKNMQGTFTIDGIQYNASVNGTFTSPSTLTNKLMITNMVQTQPMLLEGDMTSKEVPYVEGIKSAFEDEDKIEVLSTGKNLAKVGYDIGEVQDGYIKVINETTVQDIDYTHRQGVIEIKPNTTYTCSWVHLSGEATVKDSIVPCYAIYDKDMNVLKWASYTTTTPSNAKYIGRVRLHWSNSEAVFTNFKFAMQLEESPTATSYEPYKSNVTKIPLLSPLRSLPNGVYDELIIDRMKKKATLIQRIKSTVFNGSEDWNLNNYSHDKLIEFVCHSGAQMAHTVFSDRFITGGENVERVAFSGGSIYIRILKTKVSNVDSFKKWLSQNPLTVQYGLQTPLITEVNLEGYPYVYKDGHIFLNTEIAPTTEVTYSINQAHQIESSNEDILRHQKEINYLYELIAQYVQVHYEAELIDIAL